MKVTKGKSVTVRTSFKRRGIPLNFAQPPVWKVYNSDNQVIQSGVAAADGTRWAATFTIPTSYIVPDGAEDLEIEFIGYSGTNEYSRSKEVELIDEGENYRTNLVYNTIIPTKLVDSVVLPYPELEYIKVRVATPYATELYLHPTIMSPTYTSKLTSGYEYRFDIGIPDLTRAKDYTEPVQLLVEAKPPGAEPHIEVHPVYVLTASNATLVNSLQQYLDKARLVEIDPSLQWHTDEYLHYLNEGIGYINSFGEPATYWTVGAYPSSLRALLIYAASWHGLNARYMAEGFNAFEFAGANTNLNFDRRDVIATKMNELQGILDSRLPAARAAAVRAYGVGKPPDDSGQINNTAANSGVLGISLGPMNNFYHLRNRTRLLRRI